MISRVQWTPPGLQRKILPQAKPAFGMALHSETQQAYQLVDQLFKLTSPTDHAVQEDLKKYFPTQTEQSVALTLKAFSDTEKNMTRIETLTNAVNLRDLVLRNALDKRPLNENEKTTLQVLSNHLIEKVLNRADLSHPAQSDYIHRSLSFMHKYKIDLYPNTYNALEKSPIDFDTDTTRLAILCHPSETV